MATPWPGRMQSRPCSQVCSPTAPTTRLRGLAPGIDARHRRVLSVTGHTAPWAPWAPYGPNAWGESPCAYE